MNKPSAFHQRIQLGGLVLAATLGLGVTASAQAQVAARDSAASELRAPTADEAAALAAKPDAKSAARATAKATGPKGLLTGTVNPQPMRARDGTISLELDESTLMSSVARRNADGSISMYCVPAAEAERIAKGTQAVAKTTKEHSHDTQ